MQKIQNKTYSDVDGRSFDYLKDKNGQFNLKDVATHLEKKASAFTAVIRKMADKGMLTYNSREYLEPETGDFGFGSPKNAAGSTNEYGKNAANHPAADHVGDAPARFSQVFTNQDAIQAPSDKTVYGGVNKTASDLRNISGTTGYQGPSYLQQLFGATPKDPAPHRGALPDPSRMKLNFDLLLREPTHDRRPGNALWDKLRKSRPWYLSRVGEQMRAAVDNKPVSQPKSPAEDNRF